MPARCASIIALSLLVASCAANDGGAARAADAEAPNRGDCFFLSQVDGYSHAGDNRIRVSTGPGQTYEFETLGRCPDLDRAETMAFDPAGAGTICRGIDVDLIVPTDIGPRRCAVGMIRKLGPEER